MDSVLLIILILIVLAGATVLDLMGYRSTAFIMAYVGPIGVVAGYILSDARERWPNLNIIQRLVKLLTFQR